MFPFIQGLEAKKVQRYKWEAYCRTNWMCTAALSFRPAGIGVSETLLIEAILAAISLAPSDFKSQDFYCDFISP